MSRKRLNGYLSIEQEKPSVKSSEKVGKGNPPKDKQWQPGRSGNPNGRPPKARCFTSRMTERMGHLCPKKIAIQAFQNGLPPDRMIDKITWLDVYVERAMLFGISGKQGSVAIFQEILERVEGKVPTTIQGPNDGPIQVEFDYSKLNDQELSALEKILAKAANGEGEQGKGNSHADETIH